MIVLVVGCTQLKSNTRETGCVQTNVIFALVIPCYCFQYMYIYRERDSVKEGNQPMKTQNSCELRAEGCLVTYLNSQIRRQFFVYYDFVLLLNPFLPKTILADI